MNVFYNVEDIEFNKHTCLTVGTFDGVHLGHQKIINEMIYQSVERSCRNLLITFEPHPQLVLAKNSDIRLLSTLEQKLDYLKYLSIQNVLVINFTKNFSELSFNSFIEDYLIKKIGLNTIIVGADHHFGKDRQGNPKILKEMGENLGFSVIEVEPLMYKDAKISSSRIRKSLLSGEIKLANEMLGKKYELKGKVVKGNQRGKEIGFPTANIELDNPHKLIPMRGVYFVEVDINNRNFYGMMNIGYRPTFNNSSELILEVHIFYFREDIYGEFIIIRFIDKLRDEKKFNSVAELKQQLEIDKQVCFDKINSIDIY